MMLASAASGQEVQTLLSFTNEWAYNQSGLEPEPNWRTNSYSDQAWPRGRGLLGFEPDNPAPYVVHAPIQTVLTISTTVTSYYFRTTFQFSGNTAGLSLVASNLIDDGCVIYLNGEEVARRRMSPGQNAATLATSGPTTEGMLEPVTITNLSLLRQGENLFAVEVHQNAATSSDIMWGMKLVGIRDLPLHAAEEPQDLRREAGQPAQFTFTVSGSPAFYRWYRNSAIIPGAVNATLTLPSVTLNDTGSYFAVVTNSLGSITSRVATLTVFEDRTGPRLLSAVGAPQGISRLIEVTYSEPLHVPSAANPAHYRLTRFSDGANVPITNVSISPSGFPLVRLFVDASDPNWVPGVPYYLTVNEVADRFMNGIAPDSRIALTWPNTRLVLPNDAVWSFHAAAVFDPLVFTQPWMEPDFQEGPWWAQGRAIVASGIGRGPGPPCLGQWLTPVGFQREPVLFRTTFVWPGELGSQAQLRIAALVGDGAVIYLNGTELWRTNMSPGLVGLESRAGVATFGSCYTNSVVQVDNLRNGTNWVAAAVVTKPDPAGFIFVFGLELWATTMLPGPLPENPPPTLLIEPLDPATVRLSWAGAGYALESTTDLGSNMASTPDGPWQQVPDMTNPYVHVHTNAPGGMPRFFRLKR